MEQRHLIVVDEQPQSSRLKGIAENLHEDGIELVYLEINPKDYVLRQEDGDVSFDKQAFTQALREVPFFPHLDVLATDYNLIDGQLKGIDVISIFSELMPYYSKKIVIYSAQIESVISDILVHNDETFEEQVHRLKLLTNFDIDYLKSEGEFGVKLKSLIAHEPTMSIDNQLIENMMAVNNSDVLCAIAPYDNMPLNEVANLMNSKDPSSTQLKKELTDHLMALITKFKNYE